MGTGRCGTCVHFRNDPAYLEALFAGLAALGSAYASVRGEDGHCRRHDRYLSAGAGCDDFSAIEIAAGLTRRDRSPGTR
jgi:hypothetical protein